MIVTHIDGRSEILTDYKSLQRKRRVNGEYSLFFLLFQTERNEHSYPLAVEESLIQYNGQNYRIKEVTEKMIGNTPTKQIRADHIFFDLVDYFQYETISNTQTILNCLTHALKGTGYTFEVIDSFNNTVFENFGNDTALSLVQNTLNTFGAEVEINNKHLKFYRQTGPDTDIQFRYKHNIKTIEKYINTNNLSTYIKGYGKKNEDGSYVVTAEYISPNAHLYKDEKGNVKLKHAKPIYDERYTVQSELLNRIKSELIDTPEVSFKIDGVELKKAGVLTEQIDLGARVYVIYEPLKIDIKARVMEITDYPESNVPAEYVFENFRNNITDTLADFQRTKDNVDGILNGERKLPYNVLDDAVIRATEALKSAQTQLNFENGIFAIDKTNPNRMVWLNSKGIGITKNGGVTFPEALTADGFNLSAGVIGQLSANNINVVGVIQAINDGSTTIDGGRITTNSIDVGKLIAGILTGFVIQTNNNPSSPRIYMGGSKFEASNGNSRITIDTATWSDYAGLTIKTGNPDLRLHSYDNRNMISSNNAVLEIWAFSGGVSVIGDLNVQGAKNASVPTSLGNVNVSAYETAEYYFGDIGRGEVINGECVIEIESLFKETVNTSIDYEVFLTKYGKGDIYVEEMTPDYFIIKGDDIPFAYEIKAKRKGYETVRLEITHESEVEEFEN